MNNIFILSLLVFHLSGICQPNNSPFKDNVGRVVYNFSTNLGLMRLEQPAELIFTTKKSIFIHSKGEEGFVEKKVKNSDPSQPSSDGWFQDTIGSVFYKDFDKRSLIIREIVWTTPYLTEEPGLPKINWKILPEKKQIGSFNCQKARAYFRGRLYDAWFTPDIPVSDGPWKLHGLPRLILEAYNDKREIEFLFVSIEFPAPVSKDVIIPPTQGLKASFEDYKRADLLEFEKRKRRVLSAQTDREGKMEIKRQPPNLIEKEYEK